jgi:hypothetical protein
LVLVWSRGGRRRAFLDGEAALVGHTVPARVDGAALADLGGIVHASVLGNTSCFHVGVCSGITEAVVTASDGERG